MKAELLAINAIPALISPQQRRQHGWTVGCSHDRPLPDKTQLKVSVASRTDPKAWCLLSRKRLAISNSGYMLTASLLKKVDGELLLLLGFSFSYLRLPNFLPP